MTDTSNTPRTDAIDISCYGADEVASRALDLCREMERELAGANSRFSDSVSERQRLHGLLREMKAAMLGYPVSVRTLSPSALLAAINKELREPEPPR